MEDRGRGLEFLVGAHSIVVPAALVERVVEADLSPPPPLARAWLAGFGVSEGMVFVAVDLDIRERHQAPGSGSPICVLLDTAKRTGLRWALRVTRTVGFVDVTRCARPPTLPAEWPAWVAGALFKDRSMVGLLDVAGMARDYDK